MSKYGISLIKFGTYIELLANVRAVKFFDLLLEEMNQCGKTNNRKKNHDQ
jgi:hypothetical protein